ncbi:MAG: hypothetical protein HN368_17795, partial [Spirochaetales bacterium]|nr:hypothetical protein [Spirochaetales bacterium]
MAQSTKIYDYNNQKVRRILQSTLQKSSRESSVADLVSRTGLPNYQVDQTLRTMLDENRGRLKATDSGELLYYFPEGFRNFKTGMKVRVARLLRRGVRSLTRAATYLFKMWIMVMLVGYFILFVVLLIAALIASIAGSAASQGNSRSRSRGGGFGTFFLTTRLLQLFVSLWFYSDGGRGRSGNRNWRRDFRTRGRNGRPLHQSVFAFVFGGEDPDKDRENYLKRTAIRFIQENKGVIAIDELIRLTGKTPEDANIMINDMLREYEGSPAVTEEGTVYYQFGSLMATTRSEFSAIPFTANRLEMKPFNDNPQKTNRWIAFFNGFNILFGTFFLYFSLNPPIGLPIETLGVLPRLYMIIGGFLSRLGDPTGFLLVGLGIIPVIFSLVFFAVTG